MGSEIKSRCHEASFIDQDGKLRTTRIPVVQELVRDGCTHLPKRFIMADPDNPITSSTISDGSMTLPSINVAKLLVDAEPKDRAQELSKLVIGAKDWGLFIVTDHGIPSSVINGVKDVIKGFFEMSFEEKKASVGSYASTDNMGYGRTFVKSEYHPLGWLDRLTMKVAPKSVGEGLLAWPQTPPNFR